MFALGAPLFALALIGLHARLASPRPRARLGVVLAWLALGLTALAVGLAAAVPRWNPDDESFTPLSLAIVAVSLSLLASLALLGFEARRERALAAPWRALPLALAIGTVPALLVGGALSAVSERLLEIPLGAIAVAWMLIGYALWPRPNALRA